MQQAPSVDLLLIASRDRAKAVAMAAEFGIPRAYGCYDDLLADPDIDAVYVPLPNQLHVPWATRAMDQGPPTRVVGALEMHPQFGVDGRSSALLDYVGRHALITVSIHNGPTGWGSHHQLTALGTNGWFRLTFPFAHGRPTPGGSKSATPPAPARIPPAPRNYRR